MRYQELTKERQERLKKELDPDNKTGILYTLIRCIHDDWETGMFTLDSCELGDLAACCARYENSATSDWNEEDTRTLFQLEFCLYDSQGAYFDFFQDICSPAVVIMDTAFIDRNPEHLYPHLTVDIDTAIETIKQYAKDYLNPKIRTWDDDAERLLLGICREVQKKYSGIMWREMFEADVKKIWENRYPSKTMPPIEYDPFSGRLDYSDYESQQTK